jgi:hypothetical protein
MPRILKELAGCRFSILSQMCRLVLSLSGSDSMRGVWMCSVMISYLTGA